ncbi:MAG: hypothetical protein KU38_01800 [Sulfurovum sp. FS08-3]|nr:MAG: hypothetical protein KU38_01800 [Sulfurovum sp. FS08-3]
MQSIVANSSSAEDLIAKITAFKTEFEEDKKKLEDKAKKDIEEIVEQNAQEVSEKREKQKEILQFLKKIGFDLLPKDATDYVIARIKNGAIPNVLGLEKGNIDLAKGHFGESLLDKDGIAWKQNLVNFMNVVLYNWR